jgi:hypothetical protein
MKHALEEPEHTRSIAMSGWKEIFDWRRRGSGDDDMWINPYKRKRALGGTCGSITV